MKKAVIGLVGIAVLFTAAAIGLAQIKKGLGDGSQSERYKLFGKSDGIHGILDHKIPELRMLGLTEEQKAKVREIITESKRRISPLVESLRANRENLRKLAFTGSFDEKTVSEIASQSGQIISQIIVERERAKSQIYEILTEEQKIKLAELRAKREEKRKALLSSAENSQQ